MSTVKDIRASAGSLATVSATVDGVRCDVSCEGTEPVVRTTAGQAEVCRGAAVPAELVTALEAATAEARAFATDQLAGESARAPITIIQPDLLTGDK